MPRSAGNRDRWGQRFDWGPGVAVRRTARASLSLVLAALVLAGCTSTGDISNPVVRKATWFSFLNGDDIRAACRPGAPDRLRLVHNANYTKRIRVHDITATDPALAGGAPPGALRVKTRVLGVVAGDITVTVGDPSSIFAPWAGEVRHATLGPADAVALRTALARDGLGQPTPAGTEVLSQHYWWLAVGCLDGGVRFQVWAHPDRGYDRLTFPAILQARDGTGIALRTPADEPVHANPVAMDRLLAETEVRFRLAIGRDGLNPGPGLQLPPL